MVNVVGAAKIVVFFVIYPIALQMFKRANITRMLLPAAISAGCWTWSMTAPGSPSIQTTVSVAVPFVFSNHFAPSISKKLSLSRVAFSIPFPAFTE